MISTAALAITAVLTAALLAGATCWAALRVAAQIRDARIDAARARAVSLLETFAPAVAAARQDPKALLVWQPLAAAARALFAEEFAALDRAAGGAFPFTKESVQAAHAKWTADWLAWERTHDAEYKLKAAAVSEELRESPLLRARLDAVEREKLDLYQRRYQEYVQVAKALQALK